MSQLYICSTHGAFSIPLAMNRTQVLKILVGSLRFKLTVINVMV